LSAAGSSARKEVLHGLLGQRDDAEFQQAGKPIHPVRNYLVASQLEGAARDVVPGSVAVEVRVARWVAASMRCCGGRTCP